MCCSKEAYFDRRGLVSLHTRYDSTEYFLNEFQFRSLMFFFFLSEAQDRPCALREWIEFRISLGFWQAVAVRSFCTAFQDGSRLCELCSALVSRGSASARGLVLASLWWCMEDPCGIFLRTARVFHQLHAVSRITQAKLGVLRT